MTKQQKYPDIKRAIIEFPGDPKVGIPSTYIEITGNPYLLQRGNDNENYYKQIVEMFRGNLRSFYASWNDDARTRVIFDFEEPGE
jgi:hypothetical protein